MKNSSKVLGTFLLLLMAFTFSVSSYGQIPPPRKETRGGTGWPQCDLINDGNDYNIQVCLILDHIEYLSLCDLYVGYSILNSSTTYVAPSNWTYNPIKDNWKSCIYITFSSQTISDLCAHGEYHFQLDTYCLVDGEYEYANGSENEEEWNQPAPPTELDICCDPDNIIDPLDSGIDGTRNSDQSDYPLDYYIYDFNGNLVQVFRNIDSKKLVNQKVIDLTTIKTGVYIVKYWDGVQIKTEKIFKH